VTDQGAWRFWDGAAWSDRTDAAAPVFQGASIADVHYNAFLGRWIAVYSAPLSDDVVMRTAPELTGPWSNPIHLFTADRKGDTGFTYDALAHPDLAEENGRIEYVTFSRPNGQGWLASEFAVVRVELGPP
jgi:hypothetical protein